MSFSEEGDLSPEDTSAPAATGIPDELWAEVEQLIPSRPAPELGGRPRADDRAVYATVLFVTSARCSWRTADRMFGVAKSTAHRRYREWAAAGLWASLYQAARDGLGPAGLDEWIRRAGTTAGLVRFGHSWRRPDEPGAGAADPPGGASPPSDWQTQTGGAPPGNGRRVAP